MKIYDEIDIRDARSVGYWTGALAGAIGMFLLCLFVGLFLNS